MFSRGRRLVDMVNTSKLSQEALDDNPCCSKDLTELERMFDSDDSDKDPTYYPLSESLTQPKNLFGEQWDSNKKYGDDENCMQVYEEGENNICRVDQSEYDMAEEEPEINASEIVFSILELLLHRVTKSARVKNRWKKAEPENWKVNVAKKRRAEGLSYTPRKQKRSAKIPKEINCNSCFYKCSIISYNEREALCRHYWHLSFVEQKNFILSNIVVDTPKRVLAVRGSKRQREFTKKCFFFHNGEKKQVCQKFFCSTLAISSSVVNNAIQKRNDLGLYKNNDKRGKHLPPNKTSEAALNFVKKHIESFPYMEPHYIRKTSKRLYLDASLSIMKMYRLYKEKCNETNIIPVSEITYRRIFCNNYNFSFFVPKKDQCSICSNYNKSDNDERIVLKQDYEEHLARKERAYLEKTKDKERATKEAQFRCVTFDLQAVLQIPSGLVGQLYYCRKVCVYNLCIYEVALPNDAYCFTWSELNGKRGSSEIGSVLFHYLTKCVPPQVTEVCLYSDTCGGQNRNQYVAALLLFAVENIPNLQKIEHKFLESGHSYMEVDSMHSSIETAKKNSEVYCMPDYVSIFKRARSNKTFTANGKSFTRKPYMVKEFKFDEFYDLKHLADKTIYNKSKDCNGNQVKWLKIKKMLYLKGDSTKIYFNYDLSDTFLFIDVSQNTDHVSRLTTRSKKRVRQSALPASYTPTLKQLYNYPLPISEAKKKDLLSLCQKKIIPEEYHGWYSSLRTDMEPDRLPQPSIDEESGTEDD